MELVRIDYEFIITKPNKLNKINYSFLTNFILQITMQLLVLYYK